MGVPKCSPSVQFPPAARCDMPVFPPGDSCVCCTLSIYCCFQGLANADDENYVVDGVQLANVSGVLLGILWPSHMNSSIGTSVM
jgi:hypothetical protein